MIDRPSHFGRAGPSRADKALDYALEMVATMSEAGLTAVPVKPTPDMLAAGARAGDVSVETAWKIYQAMINTAPKD